MLNKINDKLHDELFILKLCLVTVVVFTLYKYI